MMNPLGMEGRSNRDSGSALVRIYRYLVRKLAHATEMYFSLYEV
jgi:hypothetical protein